LKFTARQHGPVFKRMFAPPATGYHNPR